MFIKSRFYLDDEYVDMTRNKFLKYTRLDIPEFRDTLIQHMESVKKSIGERAQHKMEYESRLIIESNSDRIKRSRIQAADQNDAHVDNADIRPINNEEPMAEVQTTAEINIFATGQQHTEQPEFNNEGKVDQNAKQCHDIRPLPAKLTDDKTIELSDQSLESENVESEAPNGSNADITNQCESKQALDVSAGTLLSTGTSFNPTEEGLRVWLRKHLHIFGCICYITRDRENLDKMKEKGDLCVMVGYSTQSKEYRVYNKRTRLIVESIHIKFDEIKEMMSDHNSSDLAPQQQEMSVENVSSGLVPQGPKASDYDNSDPVPLRQNVVPTAEKTDSSQHGLEFLFSPLLEEYYNPTHGHAEDNNNDQVPNASFQEDEFINPFCTRVQEISESSARNIDNTDVHLFQPQSHDYQWTIDHPLE
ncbi:RNA-directed DNA polymerase, eukaryota [Tanacetum coccineum]